MPPDFAALFGIAAAGGLASPIGGAIAVWKRPTTLLLSIAVGFAAGVLLATFAFEMLPKAVATASLAIAVAGFALGFALLYVLDLFVHRGASAGPDAEQRSWVVCRRRHRLARGDEVTVLAGGTSAEELIEGIVIGVSAATAPSLGFMVGLAIVIDNVSESLSIGELIRKDEKPGAAWRIFKWTGLIGIALFGSALAGWFLLKGLSPEILGFLLAAGAGGMFYLTVTDLVPQAQRHHFDQSAGVATAAGFLTIFALSNLV